MNKIFSLLCLCFVAAKLSASPWPTTAPNWQPVTSSSLATQNVSLAAFNAISVEGNVAVNVFAGQTAQQLYITGPGSAQHCVNTSVTNGTLYIAANHISQNCSAFSVNINMGPLTQITLTGPANLSVSGVSGSNLSVFASGGGNLAISGNNINLTDLTVRGPNQIYIRNLNSPALNVDALEAGDITLRGKINLVGLRYHGVGTLDLPNNLTANLPILDIEGSGTVKLHGVIHTQQLIFAGPGLAQIYWLSTPQLSISAEGNGIIELAGVTSVLHTNLWNGIHLEARFLRAKTGFIETHDVADANVWVSDTLFTFANQHSNIYYYTKPQFLTTDNRYSGSVLAMYNIPGALLSFQPGWFDNH